MKMPPPRPTAFELPPVMVRPAMATLMTEALPLSMMNTRRAFWPLTVRADAPGPAMETLLVIASVEPRLIVPVSPDWKHDDFRVVR